MTAPFQPADGEKGRARRLAELVAGLKPGDDITYTQAMELLDCDLPQVRQAMNDARKILEEGKARSVQTIDKYGWIVLDARGNLDEVDRRKKRASRAVTRSIRLLNATPREELSQIERARMDFQGRQLLGARGLYDRKSKSFTELERDAKRKEQNELPFRRPESA